MLGLSSKISNYYKNVIEYSDITEVSVPIDQTGKYPMNGYVVTRSQLALGQVDDTILSKFFVNSDDNVQDVTIALDAFRYGKNFKAAMWVTASLQRGGALNISIFPSYNISQSYLAPFATNISVGSSVDDLSAVQGQYSLTEVEEWSTYIQTIFSIKTLIIKKIEIDFIGVKSEIKDAKNYIFKGNLIAKMNANILSFYQKISDNKRASLLSEKMAEVALRGKKYKKEARITLTPKLSGALSTSKFIPNFEQWKSIETVLKSTKGQLTAVQGPPGTGKTSLLQFVIASMVVNSVYDTRPGLLMICSTNNQAVTNAVESLALNTGDRWILTDVGLGLYVPSNPDGISIPNITINKNRKSNKMHVSSKFLEPFLQFDQFSNIKKNFLGIACKNLHLNSNASLQDVAKQLKKRVISSQKRLQFSIYKAKIRSMLKYCVRGMFGQRNDAQYYNWLREGNWDKNLEIMKTSFLYALHYWEARFLERIEDLFTQQDKGNTLEFRSFLEAIETLSLFTPFLGMTLHQLAKHFGGINVTQVATESIGLLILDEAGQICPEIGFFALSLAQKALIIGDSMQLEPIHAISENEDERLSKAIKIEHSFKSSIGNFMDMAHLSADYSTCLFEH